jgi:molybdate transport system permease protein
LGQHRVSNERSDRAPILIAAVLAAILMFLLIMPLVALVIRTLTSSVGMPIAMLEGPLISATLVSLTTTAISAAVIVLLGTPLAYVFARYRFPLKSLLNVLIELPIVMPPVVAGLAGLIGYWLAGVGISLPFSMAAVILAQIFVAAPFYVRTVQARFAAIPRELEDAASIDGASAWQIFRGIILPLSWQALTVGLILAWARALGEFGATVLFAGNLQGRTQTLPLLVYSALEQNLSAALWAGLLLIGLALVALIMTRWLARRIADADTDADPLSER